MPKWIGSFPPAPPTPPAPRLIKEGSKGEMIATFILLGFAVLAFIGGFINACMEAQ